jgi:hypothetical protein
MKNVLLFSFILFCISCSEFADNQGFDDYKSSAPQAANERVFEEAMEADYTTADDQSSSVSPQNVAPKLIKNAEMRIEVKNIDAGTASVEQLVASVNGRISRMNRVNNDYRKENNITLRIPADQFDAVIKGLAEQAVYQDYLRVSTRDVTEEYLDIETRLKTKRAVRDRYVEVLRKQAKTVEEILQAEEAIRRVQEEIESREGRLRYLKDQIGYSTIQLELYEKSEGPTPSRYTFLERAKESLQNGWELIQGTALVLLSLWPFVLLLLLAIWLWRRRVKKRVNSGA